MKKGDRVRVMNSTLSGKLFFEGTATIVRLIGKREGGFQRAMVHFDEDAGDCVVERNIEEVEA
jgi:hypothetical protein